MNKNSPLIVLFFLLIISCKKENKNGNQVLFDGIKFTVISEGLIYFTPSNNFTTADKKDSIFSSFEVQQTSNQLIISTHAQKFIYTANKKPLIERVLLEFKKNKRTIRTPICHKDKQNLGAVIQRADRMDGRLEHRYYDISSPTTPKQFPNGLLS